MAHRTWRHWAFISLPLHHKTTVEWCGLCTCTAALTVGIRRVSLSSSGKIDDYIKILKKFEILTQTHRLTSFKQNPKWPLMKFDTFIFCQNTFDSTLKHQQTSFPGSI